MYTGNSIVVPCDGGWNANPNTDQVAPSQMIDVENINIHHDGREPRGGCDEIANITSSPAIMGIFQFFRENGTLQGAYLVDEGSDNIGDEDGNMIITEGTDVVTVTDSGIIYKNYSTSLKTGLTNNLRAYFETFYDELYISNGTDTPQVWGEALAYTWDMGSPKKPTAALGSGAGNVDDGTHSYKITFVSSSGESTGGVTSAVVTVADKAVNGKVDLSDIPLGLTNITSRKIYRTIAGDTGDYLLVDTIADNTTTTYEDNTADAGLGAAAPTTSLALLPSDWVNNMPKYFMKRSNGTTTRLVAFGCKTKPNYFYFSTNGEADFSDDYVTTKHIMTEEITGAVEFGNNFLFFDRNWTYIFNDTPLTVANWGYQKANWKGGAAHQSLIIKTPTDIAVMDESGELFSIRASQQYGDYQIASLTRPVYLHKWIEDNVDLEQIENFHGIYDPEMRAIKIFVILDGDDHPKCAMVYFIDRGVEKGWTKHTYQITHLNSCVMRVSVSDWKIHTGSYNGYIQNLESTTLTDRGYNYLIRFILSPLSLNDPRMNKRFDNLNIVLNPKNTETIYGFVTIDNRQLNSYIYSSAGYVFGGSGGEILKNTDEYYLDEWTNMTDMPPPGRYLLSSFSIRNKGYVLGGRTSGVTTSQVSDVDEYYLNIWGSKTEIPSPTRDSMASFDIESKGYICGGYNGGGGGTVYKDTDEYDPDTWTSKTDMPSPERNSGVGIPIDDAGYVIGGSGSNLKDTDEYDPDVWTSKTDMPSPARNTMGGSAILNAGYVYGGYAGGDLQDTDEYDPDTWTSKTDIPSPGRYAHAASTVNDLGYIYAGTGGGKLQNTDEYSPDLWTSKTDMPSPARSYLTASTMTIYLLTNPYTISITESEDDVENKSINIGATGKRIKSEFINVNQQNFFIAQIIFDVTELGY